MGAFGTTIVFLARVTFASPRKVLQPFFINATLTSTEWRPSLSTPSPLCNLLLLPLCRMHCNIPLQINELDWLADVAYK